MKNILLNRRATTRVIYQRGVELISEQGQAATWTIMDISLQGMQVKGQDIEFFPLGGAVKYKIELATNFEKIAISGEGKVVWNSEAGKMNFAVPRNLLNHGK